jgi:hypothetical protein
MSLRLVPRRKTSKLTALATAAALAIAPVSVLAEPEKEKGPPVIRDAEAEQLLRDYTRPILRAAGLEKQNIQIVIINEMAFNAFVADGRRIFVNSGAIMQSETPNQLIGVLAHETGHLAGGHLAKMREQMARAQTQMIIAMLLGAGALVAGAKSNSGGGGGLSNAGAAVIAGPQEMIRRTLISYVRQPVRRARCGSLCAVASDACRARCGTGGNGADQSLLGQEGRSGPATAPRHGARQDRGVHGAAGHRLSPLSAVERKPARALCACDLDLPSRRFTLCARPDRPADPGAAQQPVFL